MNLQLLSILAVLFLPLSPALGHGGTEKWMKTFGDRRSALEGKIRGVSVEHLWSEDGRLLQAKLWNKQKADHEWVAYDTETGNRAVLEKEPSGMPSVKLEGDPEAQAAHNGPVSPDQQWTADVAAEGVRLKRKDSEAVTQKFALPEGSKWQDRIEWAPDSRALVAWHVTQHPVRQVTYVRSSPDGKTQPETFTRPYPKPGDTLNIPKPVVFFTDGREPLALDETISRNPFEIRRLRWHPDARSLTVEFIARGFGEYKLIEIDVESRTQRVLLSEQSDSFIYVYGNTHCHHLANGEEILWMSQASGFNHLYLASRRTGEIIRPLTQGNWIVRKVVSVDEGDRSVIASVSGIDPGQDPYFIHFIRVSLDTGAITRLTESNGTHEIMPQPDGGSYLARWSRVDPPPVHELRRWEDGTLIATLPLPETADLESSGWRAPQPFVAKDRNGKYDIHGIILRPLHFDPAKKYPVVENIYAGPHDSFVPKSWSVWRGHMSEMADSGFIVVQIDGLGTNNRGREFHEVAFKNLMDAGLPDRIRWMREAAAKHPEMDLTRVGIYGGSAGGQSALAALLNHPEFYKAAAADCGCHDNRMDKIWWNEQWMGWPVDEAYVRNSNLTHISKLAGALLLTVGEVDTNVDPSSTYQVVDALIKADKDFEYIMVPGGGHGVGEIPHLRRKRIEFFQRHLR